MWIYVALVCLLPPLVQVPLVWEPERMTNPHTGRTVYGAGIQYGQLLREAAKSVPRGGKVALINISWDGGDTGLRNRSACPYVVQVMNVNAASPLSVGLLGYRPVIEGLSTAVAGGALARKYVTYTTLIRPTLTKVGL